MPTRSMRIADVVDHEVQLARDEELFAAGGSAMLAKRDAAISAERGLARLSRGEAAAGWVAAMRERDRAAFFPGRTVEASLRWVRFGVTAAGFVLGAGAMSGFLALQPVNVWRYLLAFVFVQVLLLAFTLYAVVVAGRAGEPGPVQELLLLALRRVARRALRRGHHLEEAERLVEQLKVRRELYARLEPWLLLGLGQAFGVAFNVGAALAVLGLVTFTEIHFSWHTTLGWLDASRLHEIVVALAAPWRGAFPDALPSLAVLEATRNTLSPPGGSGAWWPFMLAALLVYGLAPRAALLALAGWRRRALLRELPPGDVASQALLRRLGIAGPRRAEGKRWDIVSWRETPFDGARVTNLVRELGGSVGRRLAAGGAAYEGHARAVLGDDPARRGIVVLAEAGEPPDRATQRFLAEAREVLGDGHVHVVLTEPGPDGPIAPREADVRRWRIRTAAFSDTVRLVPFAPVASGGQEPG